MTWYLNLFIHIFGVIISYCKANILIRVMKAATSAITLFFIFQRIYRCPLSHTTLVSDAELELSVTLTPVDVGPCVLEMAGEAFQGKPLQGIICGVLNISKTVDWMCKHM